MPSWDAVCVRKHSILFSVGGRNDFIFSLSRKIEKGLMQLFCDRYNEINNDIAGGSIIFVNLQNHLRLGKQSCINMAWQIMLETNDKHKCWSQKRQTIAMNRKF